MARSYRLGKWIGFAVVLAVTNAMLPSFVFGAFTTLEREAAQKAVEQLVSELTTSPKVEKLKRIAVYELDNDEDATVTDLLINRLTQTQLTVVLRNELERVMKEHEFEKRRSDLLDKESVIELGKFLGVEGIIFGKISERWEKEGQAHLFVSLRLASIETGEAVWGSQAEGMAGAPPPAPTPAPTIGQILTRPTSIVIILCGVLIIIWLIVYLSKPVAEKIDNLKVNKVARLDRDKAVRNRMVRELQSAIENLRSIRDIAHSAGKAELVKSVRECETAVQVLRDEIDTASYGTSIFFTQDKVDSRHLDKMLDFEKTFDAMLGDITRGSLDVKTAVTSGDTDTQISKLNTLTKRLRDKFKERADYLTGLG